MAKRIIGSAGRNGELLTLANEEFEKNMRNCRKGANIDPVGRATPVEEMEIQGELAQ